jgi:type I restriction enzyme, R subunit
MAGGENEAFSRVLIDRALESSDWDILDRNQVEFEANVARGRADYLLKDRLGRVICVLEAKREDLDPYDAKEQARGYAQNLRAPFVMLSNGQEHWFWNYERATERDAYRIERLPSRDDLERLRLKNLQPPRPLLTEVIDPEYLRELKPDLQLRGYQIRAMDSIASAYDSERRRKFLLEMATGTGKTLLCAALIRRFLKTRNAERVLFIVDRIELARQTMEDFNVVLREYRPVIYKTARRTGELRGSSVVVATIQSLMTDRRYRSEFTPFYFDLVINDEAHRSIYGDAREAVQFFQATRIGLTATPRAYLKNIDVETLASDEPRALEARELRDTYHYFGCEPGNPTFRYDLTDAVTDPEGPFLCLPKIIDCRSDITTQSLQDAGWTIVVNEQEESFKVQDLERKIFTPHRNRVMCESFLDEAQREPSGEIGKAIIFAVNQVHATAITKVLNAIRPGIALTITSRVPESSILAKEFRDGQRTERVAVSVDMLSTGYNCRDLLNVVLMRPIFSPTQYIQIKGRGTRRFTFRIGNTEYEKRNFFLIDFCAVAEYFEEKYDYSAPLRLPSQLRSVPERQTTGKPDGDTASQESSGISQERRLEREIPVWEGTDVLVSQEVRIVGPQGEKVDVMTFRGSFEQDLRDFAANYPRLREAVDTEDDDTIETILQEQFYYRPEMFYAPDKLMLSYGIPAPTSAFVYNAMGKRPLPTRDEVIADTVDSIAARFDLRYTEQKWVAATAALVVDDLTALADFMAGRYQRLFDRYQFRVLGGLPTLAEFENREAIFEALRQSSLLQCAALIVKEAS